VAGRDSEGGARAPARGGEVLLSACVLALGIAFAAGAWLLPDAPAMRASGRVISRRSSPRASSSPVCCCSSKR